MNLARLAWGNIAGSPIRSAMVFLCVALVASSAMWATLVVQGAEASLRQSMANIERPVADITVVAQKGATSTGMSDTPAAIWPGAVATVPGVAMASPQVRLTTLYDNPLCADQEMYLVAFDPVTDFAVGPWLERNLKGGLQVNEAVAGSRVRAPSGPGNQRFIVGGYELDLVGQMSPTGTNLDQSLFVTFETARYMVRLSRLQTVRGDDDSLNIVTSNPPVILVKVKSGSDPHEVAVRILQTVPNAIPFDNTSFFQAGREQMANLLNSIPGLLGITWVLSVVFIGLVFTVAVNERQREVGVLRALGATRFCVLRSILAEGSMLALGGGVVGVILTALAVWLLRDKIVQSVGLPILTPSPMGLLVLGSGGLALALVSVTIATLFPALRISRRDPAQAMRG